MFLKIKTKYKLLYFYNSRLLFSHRYRYYSRHARSFLGFTIFIQFSMIFVIMATPNQDSSIKNDELIKTIRIKTMVPFSFPFSFRMIELNIDNNITDVDFYLQ